MFPTQCPGDRYIRREPNPRAAVPPAPVPALPPQCPLSRLVASVTKGSKTSARASMEKNSYVLCLAALPRALSPFPLPPFPPLPSAPRPSPPPPSSDRSQPPLAIYHLATSAPTTCSCLRLRRAFPNFTVDRLQRHRTTRSQSRLPTPPDPRRRHPTSPLGVVLLIAPAQDAVGGECDCMMPQLGSNAEVTMFGAECSGSARGECEAGQHGR